MNDIQTEVEVIPEQIVAFIKSQTCMSICCIGEELPWCFSCFYAFDAENKMLYYKSSAETKHSSMIMENGKVAGTILPDKLKKVSVQGIQFQGIVLAIDDPLAAGASTFYHRVHPMALAIPGQLWTVQLDHIKMTDSTLGFGKKIIWKRVY